MELMITIAIIGILSALAIPTFTSYVYKSRTAEATTFLAEIKQRQESYRAEFGQYADASGGPGTRWPNSAPGANPVAWGAAPAGWIALGAAPEGQVRFRYSSTAGNPGAGNGPGSKGFGSDLGFGGNDFWFVSQAVGDLDGDGTTVLFESYSASSGVYCDKSEGWE